MATRLGKRPHPKNYAMYDPRGKAKYRKDLAEYLKKKAAVEKEKNKLSTKKNLDKQKTANKKASTTTKTKAKSTTTVKPKATATKAKSLATGKTTSKTKAVETVKTPKTTTTKRRAATSTKKKVTPKAKPKATVKKPAGKVPAKKPLISNKNKLRIKKAATSAKNTTVKTAKAVGKKIGEAKKTIATKSTAVKKAFKKKSPKPTTPAQKAVSKVYQGTKKYGKRILKKGGKDLLRIGKGILKNPKSAVKGGVAGIATAGLTDAINTRMDRAFAKRKGMTLKEYQAFKKDPKNQRGIISATKKVINKVRGKSGESSTTKNINKQKKTNNTGLKIKKTQYSSKTKNTNKDYNAKTAKKQYNPKMATFREDRKANRDLQLEVQNQGNKKNKTVTYSRVLSTQAKNQVSDTKKNKKKKVTGSSFKEKFIKTKSGSLARRGSVAARRAENREKARKRAQEMARRRLANK